jgi:hypothetical protein
VRPQHIRAEEARVFHEDLWRAYHDPAIGRLYVAASARGVQVDAKKFQDARHRFWRDRGFKLCCETAADGQGFYCWLELKAETRAA